MIGFRDLFVENWKTLCTLTLDTCRVKNQKIRLKKLMKENFRAETIQGQRLDGAGETGWHWIPFNHWSNFDQKLFPKFS